MRRSQSPVILAIISMAIVLAIGIFLAITYLQRRPEGPAAPGGGDALTVNVEGVLVTLRADLTQQVRIVNPSEQQPVPPADQPPDQPPAEGTQPTPGASTDQSTVQTQEQTPIPTFTPEILPTPDVPRVITIDYLVQDGDTLYSIAVRPDTAIVLMAEKGLSQDDIVPGQIIPLPVGNPAVCPDLDRQPYAVRENDTAYAIGQRFNTTADEIQAMNGLDENFSIFAGEILCVPQ